MTYTNFSTTSAFSCLSSSSRRHGFCVQFGVRECLLIVVYMQVSQVAGESKHSFGLKRQRPFSGV